MRFSHLMTIVVFVCNTSATLHQVITDLIAGRNTAHFQKRFRLTSFIAHSSYVIALITIYLSYTQLTGSVVLDTNPKVCLLAFGGEFLTGCLRMQVCSVTKEDFTPYRSTTMISWALMFVNGIHYLATGKPLINECLMMTFICMMVWISVALYIFNVLQTFKRVLGIEVFKIVPKTKELKEKQKSSNKRKNK